ncbi:hypothetical protein GCM10010252_76650 [Streptomyces aureoverticillatus]|nr:hypothetical protein GCM10010252_76650 [Streptomyces aureoverticillatus]
MNWGNRCGTPPPRRGGGATVRCPLPHRVAGVQTPTGRRSLKAVAQDRAIVATTAAFLLFNIAEGMLLVVGPWRAENELPGGAPWLGVLIAAVAAGGVRRGRPGGQRPGGEGVGAADRTVPDRMGTVPAAAPHPA